jgi:ATP-dependent helicase/nuclease subunit A
MQDAGTRAEIVTSTGKSMLVEAAAGTGKTTLIVDRILQGIRAGTHSLAATVAITFTEKAAGELESRLRARLVEEPHRPDVSEAERARLLTAAEELDRAQVSTIHAFCARILKEKPAEAGVDPEFTVLDEPQAQVLRERCWREWMNLQVAQGESPLADVLRAGVAARDLRQIAFKLAAAPEILDDPRYALDRPAELIEELTRSLREAARQAAEAFDRDLAGRGNDQSRALRDLVRRVAAARPDDAPAIIRRAYGIAAAPLDKVMPSFLKDSRPAVGVVLEKLAACAGSIGARTAHGTFESLKGFIAHYADAKRLRSALDFQDLLFLAARMLRTNPAVRRYFQQRFEAFFVDEFQDTDPLQAEIVSYLCERHGVSPAARMEEVVLEDGKLVAVGDPKQSIYRFRRADVRVYEAFKRLFGAQTLGEDRVRQVYCNFRSSRPLLDCFNRFFERVFAMPTEGGAVQAAHVPLAPGREEEVPPGPCVVAVCPPRGLAVEGWNALQARRHEAGFLACAVRDAVEGDGLPGWRGRLRYADFAFLFRALGDVDVYQDALDRQGVPSRLVGSRHFYRREQVAETLALLRAIDDPLDEAAVVGALRSSFFGASDEDLLRYRQGGGLWNYLHGDAQRCPVGEAMSLLAGWHRRRNRMPPHVLLREVFDVTKAPQAFRVKPAGPQRAANLDKMLNDLRALGAATGTFGALVRHLRAVQEEELPEEESVLLEPGDDYVQMLSIHKAKGLEFGAVVLPDLFREFGRRDRVPPLLFNRQDGRVGLKVGRGIQSGSYEALAVEERGNELAELHRLLYVAWTRARRLLVLPLYWAASRGASSFQGVIEETGLFAAPDAVPYGGELGGVFYLDTGKMAGRVDVAARPSRLPVEPQEEVPALVAQRQAWQESHRRLAASASSAEPCVLPSSLEEGFQPAWLADESPAGPGGRSFGALFHALMRAVPLDAAPRDETERLVRNLATVEADGLGLGADESAEAARLALRALANAEFRSLLSGAEQAWKEAAFCVPLARLPVCQGEARGFVEGSVDLLLEAANGTMILDYKTDRVGPEALRQAAEHYWPQLGLYGLAAQACGRARGPVELALFFVRTGHICRRRLDSEVVGRVADLVAQATAAGPP